MFQLREREKAKGDGGMMDYLAWMFGTGFLLGVLATTIFFVWYFGLFKPFRREVL